MSVVVHDQPVVCTENEFAQFIPPQGQTCQQWAGPYIQQIGGYLSDPGNTTLCQYCQYANGDQYVDPEASLLMIGGWCERILCASLEGLWNFHVSICLMCLLTLKWIHFLQHHCDLCHHLVIFWRIQEICPHKSGGKGSTTW
jgi:hypothetical protein